MDIIISPAKLSGKIKAVSSKSQAHRALICEFLSGENLSIDDLDISADIKATFDCLNDLKANKAIINCRQSGSTLRFLLPVILALGKTVTVIGEGRLPQRPICTFIEELSRHGAIFSSSTLPFELKGCLKSGVYTLPGNISSQFISGLLFALPILHGDSKILIDGEIQSKAYIDMTINMLKNFNITADKIDNGYFIKGNQKYIKTHGIKPQGDWSNAGVFLAMDALGAQIDVLNLDLDSLQADKVILKLLTDCFGAKASYARGIKINAPSKLKTVKIDVSQCPDLFPVLAVCACAADGESILYNAKRLRFKESDRISSTACLINSLGGEAVENDDSLIIKGKGYLLGGEIDCFDDHRIVMAATLASLICEGKIIIKNAQAINKSYPKFFEDFLSLGGNIDVIDNGQ